MTENGAAVTYSYNAADQLISQTANDTTVNYTYDHRGNCIQESGSGKTVTMAYSVLGEMTEWSDGTLTQENLYDYNGQRIKRTEGSSTDYYFYENGVVSVIEDSSSVTAANLLTNEGGLVGSFRGETYHNYLKDGQASTTNLIKQDGTLAAAYDYSDFGETTEITGSSLDNQICYTGGIYDKDTGLYYLNARYYNPEIGRFLSQDSYRGELDDVDQWHLYAYCANNPINYVDSSGHIALPIYMFGVLIFSVVACAYTSTAQFQEDWQEAVDAVAAKYSNSHKDTKKAWRALFSAILSSFAKAAAVYTTNEVHHIVAKTAKKAKLARRIYVTRTKHEIDDPRNLIPLKKGLHKRLHRKQYFELVNVIVSKAYHSTKTYKKKVNKVDNAVKKIRNSLSIMNEASPF